MPFFADFHNDGRYQAQARGLVGEKSGHAGTATDFPVKAFQAIGGAKQPTLAGGKGEDRQALGQVMLHPDGQFRGQPGVFLHRLFKKGFGIEQVGSVENGADVSGHLGFHVLLGHISLGILLEMELAALPEPALSAVEGEHRRKQLGGRCSSLGEHRW